MNDNPTIENAEPSATAPSGDPQLTEFNSILGEIRGAWSAIRGLPAEVQTLRDGADKLAGDLRDVRRQVLSRPPGALARCPGQVSEECARHLAAQFIVQCERSDKLDALSSVPGQRDALLNFARGALNLSTRAALTATDITMPVQYGSELRELISQFGVARKRMSPYPLGMGTARPARMGARPAFGSIAMSAQIAEKSPTLSFASLESHKIGGIVRLPRELDEQSAVPMGQFLARYGAIEFARAEDKWGFLADGEGDYESVKGVVPAAIENNCDLVLPAGKTKPSDATLEDFRAMRRLVNKAALNGRLSAYYLDTTWETRLPSFRSQAEPNVYQRLPDGSAILDGYPVVWTDVLAPYSTVDSPGSPLAVFGALSFWWLAEHGHPRIDPSEHVWFANDQLAIRFIEEIDFDFAARDAVAALLTPEA
ncbi:MAG TPA: phage major capsid protein [Verrucomicrobiae bacterium]|nr:phage major capsid protein [Verrucomicrobiae bacterium]